jgi:hypothetical protein
VISFFISSVCLTQITIISSHLYLGFSSDLFLYFFYLFNIDYNNILPSVPRTFKWSLSLFLLVTVTRALIISHYCYVTYTPKPSLFDQPNNIWCRVQSTHLIIKPFLPSSCHIHSSSNVLLSNLYSNFLDLYFLIGVSARVPLISSKKYFGKSLEPIFYMVWHILLCCVLLANYFLFLLEFSRYSAAVNYWSQCIYCSSSLFAQEA